MASPNETSAPNRTAESSANVQFSAGQSVTSTRDGGVPLGHGGPDEAVNTLPAEPSQITRLNQPEAQANGNDVDKPKPPRQTLDEEPELRNEDDLPSDGRDKKGEAMIAALGDSAAVRSVKGTPSTKPV